MGQIRANMSPNLLPKNMHPSIVQKTMSAHQKLSDWRNDQFDGRVNFVLASGQKLMEPSGLEYSMHLPPSPRKPILHRQQERPVPETPQHLSS